MTMEFENITFISPLSYIRSDSNGWKRALSINKNAFFGKPNDKCLKSCFKHVSVHIYTFLMMMMMIMNQQKTCVKFVKHRGFFAFSTTASFNLCVPAALAAQKIDILSLLILCQGTHFQQLGSLMIDDDD